MTKTQASGGTLSGDEIRKRLDQGEIFLPGTWSPENIRVAAYDLRMADDLLVVPDPPEFTQGRIYKRGERRVKEVILHPGDVAFASSLERLCMPWDLSGILGPKFSLTARGILILTGIFVDPGYGWTKTPEGNWVAQNDQRLHFLVANVGSDSVVFTPRQQRIAAMQFCKVTETPNRVEVPSKGFEEIERDFFDTKVSGEAGLVFFRNMANVQSEVEAFRQQIRQFNQQIGQFDQRLSSVESASNQILMFGVYLLCATILGVSIAVIFSLIANLKFEVSWTNVVVLCGGFFTLGWIVYSFMKFIHRLVVTRKSA